LFIELKWPLLMYVSRLTNKGNRHSW